MLDCSLVNYCNYCLVYTCLTHAYTAVLLSVDALLVLELVPSLCSILNMLDCLLVD